MACRPPVPGTIASASFRHGEVVVRLAVCEKRRLRQLNARSMRFKELLERIVPNDNGAPSPFIEVIHDSGQVATLYEQLHRETKDELLVFNRPPYFSPIGTPRPVVIDTCRRVRTRVLYQRAQAGEMANELWRSEMAAYHRRVPDARVVDELPIKLAVFDRMRALFTLPDFHSDKGRSRPRFRAHPQFGAGQCQCVRGPVV